MKARSYLLLALLLPPNALGQVGPVPGTQRVEPVFDKSDLVCMCTAESAERSVQGGFKDSEGRALVRLTTTTTFAIALAYKGNGSVGRQLAVRWVYDSGLPLPPEAPFRRGQPFLLFLVSTSPTTYETADRFIGMTPFAMMPTAPVASGLPGLELTLAEMVRRSERQDKLRALRLLEGLDAISRQTQELVRGAAGSGDFEMALTAWAVLLKTKGPGTVEGLSAYLDAHRSTSEPTFALIGVEDGLSRIRDKRTLASLGQLAASRYFQIRAGALYALRGMKDPRSAPTLIQRLDDDRPELRYLALITLAETFQRYGDYAPSMYLFDRRPQYYTALWKQWWQEQGSALVQPKASE